ncbi:MAG: dolichol monophosphate mannose synthase [Kordiimonadales bacterium]|nr:MAG: dolichol monophosphate mannose synthase [Kordiimonadales bacterium]
MAIGSQGSQLASSSPASGPLLSIVVPTFNEVENVAVLVDKIAAVMPADNWEIIFVDDNSPDGTSHQVRDLASRDSRVRCVQRIGRRGLSTACIEGFLASAAPYLAVIDADMQHDERILPALFKAVAEDGFELAIGSRYIEGGGFGEWDESRINKSKFATRLSNFVTKADLSDPMSGFFLMKREVFDAAQPHLSSIGFKILLDIFVSSPEKVSFTEVAYEFRERVAGESKLDTSAMWDYFMLLADKTVGHIIPVRFLSFGLVGGTGVVVHFAILWLAFQMLGTDFTLGQGIATIGAMSTNFLLNNLFTYRDQRLKGVWQLLRGWVVFMLACSIGAASNIGIADYLYQQDQYWVLSALAGIMIGTLWNYAVTALFVWKK